MNKVGFIGFGNMAEAIITGMISSGNYSGNDIGAFDTDEDKLIKGAEKLGITAYKSNYELVSECDVVVLAVKPIALQAVITPLKELFCKVNPLVISIAAGQSRDTLKKHLGYDAKIVRVMPNINAIANQAISGYCFSEAVSAEEKKTAVMILDSFGLCVEIEEDKFSVYSAVAGCSPAYIYLFADAVARVGVKYGLSRKETINSVLEVMIDTIKDGKFVQDKILDEKVLNALECAYKKDKGMQ